ncbi:MAG: phosphonate ABC transporter, permease protein PhnE [Clostridia bacterium]|nr:phosphonate ABC transporter, permease protein PhnE [Clostridia bacterium]
MAKTKSLLNADHPLSIEEAYESRPRLWWMYTIVVLIVAALLGWSGTSISYHGLASKGMTIAQGIGYGLIHPDVNLLFNLTNEGVPYQLLQTVAIAVLGTIIGGILAIPFSFLACDKIVPKPVALIFRTVILGIRTIPSLVWALVWIRVTGPNAFCGVVTESVCSIGMICKMYITAIEDIDTKILESLDAAGCNGFQKIRYGMLPQIIPNFISTVIYRFDINVKDATTLGIVGAGGIGAALIQCMNSSRWSMVGAYLAGMIVLMILIELFSTRVRAKLARG